MTVQVIPRRLDSARYKPQVPDAHCRGCGEKLRLTRNVSGMGRVLAITQFWQNHRSHWGGY